MKLLLIILLLISSVSFANPQQNQMPSMEEIQKMMQSAQKMMKEVGGLNQEMQASGFNPYSNSKRRIELDEKYGITKDSTVYPQLPMDVLMKSAQQKAKLVETKNWNQLESILIEEYKSHPQVPDTHEALIVFYLNQKKFDKADSYLSKAQSKFPKRGDIKFLKDALNKVKSTSGEPEFIAKRDEAIKDWGMIKSLAMMRGLQSLGNN